MKIKKYIIYSVSLIFVLVIIVVFIFVKSSCNKKSIGRYQFSNDSLYDCGATTSYRDDIYILKKDENISWFSSPILSADKSDGLKIIWLSPNKVEIKFNNARIHGFKNYWYNQRDKGLDTINIFLNQVSE